MLKTLRREKWLVAFFAFSSSYFSRRLTFRELKLTSTNIIINAIPLGYSIFSSPYRETELLGTSYGIFYNFLSSIRIFC